MNVEMQLLITFKDVILKRATRSLVSLKFKKIPINIFVGVMTSCCGSGSINLQQLALGIEVVVLLLLKQDQQTVSLSLISDTVS